MRIQNNIMAMNTHRFYTVNNNSVAKSAEKLSSGYRVNRAGDDAAGLAISEKMRSEIRGLTMASKNSQDGVSMVQTAEGALTEVHSMLQRINELAVQASNDTNQSIDRDALDAEVQALVSEINDIAKTTTFNDQVLLDGTFSKGVNIQTGARAGNVTSVSIGAMDASTIGIAGNNVKTFAAAQSTITAARSAINTVSTQRAALGAMQNRLEHKIANLDNTVENISAAESRIRDVDMAKEMTNFTKNNILSQAATAMLAQANANPQGVLSLLQ